MRAHTSRRSRVLAVTALIVAVVAFPLAALADHQFLDVPNTNTFHSDIDAIADVGVTLGCGGGNYCPDDFVTREQMAAFMNRLGALGPGKVPVVNADRLDGLTATQFARSDVPVTGHFNCMGASTVPRTGGLDYSVNSGARTLSSGAQGTFGCPLILPNGAGIIALRGVVYDNSAGGEISTCTIGRKAFANGAFATLAQVDGSGIAETPLTTTLLDDTISEPAINNDLFAYEAVCTITGSGADLQIHAISVEYTVQGLPVP